MIDIDAKEDLSDDFGKPGDDLLALAKDLALDVIRQLSTQGVSKSHRRVYFSGHNGFHVHYVLPKRSDIFSTNPYRNTYCERFDLGIRDPGSARSTVNVDVNTRAHDRVL